MINNVNSLFPWVVTDNRKKIFECGICLNNFNTMKEPAFDTGECDHKTCQDCLRQYFWDVLTDNTYKDYTYVKCPGTGCKEQYLSHEVVHVIFTEHEAMEWWTSALCSKAYISNKVLCPHPGCTGIFDAEDVHTKQCTFSECYQCHKGLCITCQTIWHPDKIKVQDESVSLQETLRTVELKDWCQCPFCFNLVERITGCPSIFCRCGNYFCYSCGGKMRGYGKCINNCQTLHSDGLKQLRAKMYNNIKNMKK